MSNKLTDLEKLIKLNGDEEKYSQGLQILNSSGIDSNRLPASLLIGIGLITLSAILNPSVRGRLLQLKDSFLRQPEAKIEQTKEPPLPPAIEPKSVPLPPSPLPETYYSAPQSQSLGYVRGSYERY